MDPTRFRPLLNEEGSNQMSILNAVSPIASHGPGQSSRHAASSWHRDKRRGIPTPPPPRCRRGGHQPLDPALPFRHPNTNRGKHVAGVHNVGTTHVAVHTSLRYEI